MVSWDKADPCGPHQVSVRSSHWVGPAIFGEEIGLVRAPTPNVTPAQFYAKRLCRAFVGLFGILCWENAV
jgi:hypothetical protein